MFWKGVCDALAIFVKKEALLPKPVKWHPLEDKWNSAFFSFSLHALNDCPDCCV
ncbi:hypothetical protein Q3H59_004153 [Pantoea sp. SORGH_AS 659]|nr:hypothetical protein [Pantoea sp. SORGH_AS_0659]